MTFIFVERTNKTMTAVEMDCGHGLIRSAVISLRNFNSELWSTPNGLRDWLYVVRGATGPCYHVNTVYIKAGVVCLQVKLEPYR